MQVYKKMFWCSTILAIISVIFTSACFKCNIIIHNIALSLLGSSILVALTSFLEFFAKKRRMEIDFIDAMKDIFGIVSDLQFQIEFLKDIETGDLKLDFSLENKILYSNEDNKIDSIKKIIYEYSVKKFEKIIFTIDKFEKYNRYNYNLCFEQYTGLIKSENKIKQLMREFQKNIYIFYWYDQNDDAVRFGRKQLSNYNASFGQFYDIWFKKYLKRIGNINEKLDLIFNIRKEFQKETNIPKRKAKNINKNL